MLEFMRVHSQPQAPDQHLLSSLAAPQTGAVSHPRCPSKGIFRCQYPCSVGGSGGPWPEAGGEGRQTRVLGSAGHSPPLPIVSPVVCDWERCVCRRWTGDRTRGAGNGQLVSDRTYPEGGRRCHLKQSPAPQGRPGQCEEWVDVGRSWEDRVGHPH
jgi:hypothetical protein